MAIAIGIMGLVLCIVGSYFIFSKAIPVEPIKGLDNFKDESQSSFDLYKDIIKKIDDVRKDINVKNKQAQERSKRWLWVIIFGTVLQILSLLYPCFNAPL